MCSHGAHGRQAFPALMKSEVTAQRVKMEVKGMGAGCAFQRRPCCPSSQEVTSPSLPMNSALLTAVPVMLCDFGDEVSD